MATKKKEESAPAAAPLAAPAPVAVPGAYPGAVPGMMPGMIPGVPFAGAAPFGVAPGVAAPFGAQPYGANPMLALFQMMQMMSGGLAAPSVDPAAIPFNVGQAKPDTDKGLDADIIRPATLTLRVKTQEAIAIGSVLDQLCLTEDGKSALGGLPKGCTMAFAGPPGKGKTRTALAGLAKVALSGAKVAFVVAEEGFHDEGTSGRDDLCSRLVKIGMQTTGLDEATFSKKVLENMFVLEAQYHKGTTWDDFVGKYRYLVEKEEIKFVVIDSLNMLDPTRNRTADNLSALKTYNHEEGIPCLCLGQIRDTGMPVGGEALQHTADAVFLIEELSMGSKEMAEKWGSAYREKIDVISCVKSVTTPRFEFPVRVKKDPRTGVLVAHEAQPADYALPPAKK